MTLREVQLKWLVIWVGFLGPEIETVLVMNGHVLHCLHEHLNVPGSSSVDKEPLTRELCRFLSHLNETSGGFSKIVAVSGSDWSNLKDSKIVGMISNGQWDSAFGLGFWIHQHSVDTPVLLVNHTGDACCNKVLLVPLLPLRVNLMTINFGKYHTKTFVNW